MSPSLRSVIHPPSPREFASHWYRFPREVTGWKGLLQEVPPITHQPIFPFFPPASGAGPHTPPSLLSRVRGS